VFTAERLSYLEKEISLLRKYILVSMRNDIFIFSKEFFLFNSLICASLIHLNLKRNGATENGTRRYCIMHTLPIPGLRVSFDQYLGSEYSWTDPNVL
jgi:hypothetical protein